MKKIIQLIALSLFCYSQILAQTPIFDMDRCMQYAVENSSELQVQQFQIKSSREDVKSAKGAFFPTLNAGVGASANFGRGIDPETNTYSNISNFSNNYEIYSSFPIFNAGALINGLKASKIGVMMGEQEYMQRENSVAIETMQIYADYLYYAECVELADEKLEQSRASLLKTEKMEQLGLKSAAEVALIASEVAADGYNQVKQINLRDQTMLTLKGVMNYPLDSLLLIDRGGVEESSCIDLESGDRLFNAAKEWLPQIRLSSLKLRDSKLQLSIAKSRFYPSLSLSGGVNTRYFENMGGATITPFHSQFRNNLGEWVGLSLTIPIVNGWSRRASVRKSKNRVNIAQLEQRESLRQLQIEIEKVVSDCSGLQKEAQQIALKVEADQLAYVVTLRKYEKGLLTVFDLQSSSHTLFQSKVEQLQIRLNYLLKERLAEYYSGKPIIRKK